MNVEIKPIHEEIKDRLKYGNFCYHSVQNLLSSKFLSKNTNLRYTKLIFCLLFCMDLKSGR